MPAVRDQQDCPVARALDVIGEKWSLLILRDLLRKGPQRFQELETSVVGIAPNTLSARLKTLEARHVIASRLYEKHPPRFEYYLTDKGKALGPAAQGTLRLGQGVRVRAAAATDRSRGGGAVGSQNLLMRRRPGLVARLPNSLPADGDPLIAFEI